MARGPDWLLGFGFQATDKNLLKFLGNVEGKFKSLSKTMKDFNKSSSAKAGGLDMSGLEKTFKARGRGSITEGMAGLEKSVAAVLNRVDTGLQHVSKTGRDISLGLQKSLETLFVDIEKGAFKSAKNLELLPEVLLQIPSLSKEADKSLTKLFDDLKSGKASHVDMVRTVKSLRKELSKTISESSGYDVIAEDAKKAESSVLDLYSILKPSTTDEIFSKAGKGLSMVLTGAIDKAKAWSKDKSTKKATQTAFDTKEIEKFNAEISKLVARLNSLDDIGEPARVKNIRKVIQDFSKRMAPASLKMGKLFARVPLLTRLFGKKKDLQTQRVELRRINKETDALEEFGDLKVTKDLPDLKFAEFEDMQRANAFQIAAQGEQLVDEYFKRVKDEAAKKDVASAILPDKDKASAQAEELAQVVAQALSPEAISAEVEKTSPGKGIAGPMADLFEQSEQELPTIFFAIERSVADLWATLKDSKAIEAAMTGLTGLKNKISDVMVHGILPMRTSMEEAMLSAKKNIADFGEYFADWVSGEYSYTFDRFRERINRSARTFMNLKTKADSAFSEILKAKELFVQEFEANFQKLSEKVGSHVGKISLVTEHEFRQLESKMKASYSHMETLSRTGTEQQAAAIVQGFDKLDQGLKNTQKSTVDNLVERSGALKKAVGLNPFPALAVLAKLGPALARVGPAAARAGAAGRAGAGGAGAAEGLSMKEALGNFFKQKTEGMARDKISGQISDRIGQMTGGGSEEHSERTPSVQMPSESNNQVVVEAIRQMADRLASQLTKMASAVAKSASAAAPSGKLKVNSDEMKRVFSTSMKNADGLSGSAR